MMSRVPGPLPHAANAIAPRRKVAHYLLDINHPEGAAKARFFLGHGYTLPDWQQLANDLCIHGASHPVTGSRPTVGGINYEVTGPMLMPDGVTGQIVTVWYIADGSMAPQLATARPAKRK